MKVLFAIADSLKITSLCTSVQNTIPQSTIYAQFLSFQKTVPCLFWIQFLPKHENEIPLPAIVLTYFRKLLRYCLAVQWTTVLIISLQMFFFPLFAMHLKSELWVGKLCKDFLLHRLLILFLRQLCPNNIAWPGCCCFFKTMHTSRRVTKALKNNMSELFFNLTFF